VSTEPPNPPPTAAELRARFDAAPAYTVGIEDEVMVLDPHTYELVPRAREVLARAGEDHRFKLELPASQLEILTAPFATVPELAAALHEGRRDLARRADGVASLGAAGFHPSSPVLGELNPLPRYRHTIREYASVLRLQLVCALQVHVSVPGADRALAVYNELRTYLPLLAALAANAPFYLGRDSGLASVRPKVGELLPRQGVPPPLPSWEAYADALAWGAASGTFEARTWWWELRLHPGVGTLELRVPDGQTTVADAAALAAVAQALAAWLGERHDKGDRLGAAPTWRIEENRWSACRHGVDGEMADVETGALRATRDCLSGLLDTLAPVATRLGAGDALMHARRLVEVNGAAAQRREAGRAGIGAVAGWLADRFLEPWPG
jgi:carboxylate-amine ligase